MGSKIRRHVDLAALSATVFVATTNSLIWGASISITSPSPGLSVTPGQTILVTVQPDTGTVLQRVTAGIAPLNQIPQVIATPPYQFSVQVPPGQIGTVSITAMALDTMGNTLQASVNVVVKSPTAASSVQVTPNRLVYSGVDGQVRSLSVRASFRDGTSAYVTNSPDVQYLSSNTKVVVVNSIGQAKAVASGAASITVTYSGFTVTIPVTVGVYPLKGDLNGDGAVDQNDLQIILTALNTTSTGTGDPRDLNNDGLINALDARILVTLCSRPGCATH
jgi:hypothetical protein